MSYWVWSNLERYSDAQLEEHKSAVKKVLEYRRDIALRGTRNSLYSFSNSFQTNYELEQQIKEIDEEITKRKQRQPYSFASSQIYFSEHGIVYAVPEYPPTDAQRLDTTQKELAGEKKTVKKLEKRLEEVTKELQEERDQSDKFQRIIRKHKCDNGNTFTSSVEQDE